MVAENWHVNWLGGDHPVDDNPTKFWYAMVISPLHAIVMEIGIPAFIQFTYRNNQIYGKNWDGWSLEHSGDAFSEQPIGQQRAENHSKQPERTEV